MNEDKNVHFEEYDEPFLQSRSSINSNNMSWALSFADIVTVLLCFFIIFYIIEKKHKQKIDYDLSKIAIQDYSVNSATTEMKQFIETVSRLPNVTVENKNNFLEVHFPPEAFYESGSVKL